MMKRTKMNNNSRGDTIVEVLITLAILGLAFGISYASANRSLIQARNAEEHSEALQYLNSQVEQIRADSRDTSATSPFNQTAVFHMTTITQIDPVTHLPEQVLAAQLHSVTLSGSEGYTESVTYTPATTLINGTNVQQDIFSLKIDWPGAGNLGMQHEQLTYKVHQNTDCIIGNAANPSCL